MHKCRGLVFEVWTISNEIGEEAENLGPVASRREHVVGSYEVQSVYK